MPYLLVLAVPGSNVLVVGTAAMLHGERAAVLASLGVAAGIALLTGAVMLALDTTQSFAPILDAAGPFMSATILFWLSWRLLRTPRPGQAPLHIRDRGFLPAGFVTAVTNPVTAAFAAAQLLGPLAGCPAGTRALLPALLAAEALFWLLCVAVLLRRLAAAGLLARLRPEPVRALAGLVMILVAAVTVQPVLGPTLTRAAAATQRLWLPH